MRITAPVLTVFRRAPARRTWQERVAHRQQPAPGSTGHATGGTAVLDRPNDAGVIEPPETLAAEGDGERTPAGDANLPERWEGTVILEGVRTSDARQIKEGALSWRPLPLPLMFQKETQPGHWESVMAGNIETLERRDGGVIWGTGRLDLGSEDGREAARQMQENLLRWVSADVSVEEWELIEEGECDLEDILFGGGEDCVIVEQINKGDVMGATLCYFPAFEDAVVEPAAALVAAAGPVGDKRRYVRTQPLEWANDSLVASLVASLGVESPPAEWFEDPALTEPTPFTVTDDGRVFGHLALWGTCHIGRDDVCIEPPHSATDYAYYMLGEPPVEGVAGVGKITMATGHAALDLRYQQAVSHYDDTGTVVCEVASGEDDHGIWVAGALSPGVDELSVRRLKASALSGDWRRIGGVLELVAVLAVNVPGYPVPRARSLVAGGEQLSLVASLGPQTAGPRQMAARVAGLEAEVRRLGQMLVPLRPAITAALQEQIRGDAAAN